jgi:hypothetical protein
MIRWCPLCNNWVTHHPDSHFIGEEMKQPTFEIASCKKCGSTTLLDLIQYHSDMADCRKAGSKYTCDTGEHLHITCPRCGYDWCIPTLDSREEK